MKEVKRILKTEKKKDILYPMYIDTHTHLHHRRFDKDRKLVLEQMADVGIQAFLEVAMDLKSNAIMREKLRKALKVKSPSGLPTEGQELTVGTVLKETEQKMSLEVESMMRSSGS